MRGGRELRRIVTESNHFVAYNNKRNQGVTNTGLEAGLLRIAVRSNHAAVGLDHDLRLKRLV